MLESSSKLMYYPTNTKEIYRMLGVVGRVSMSVRAREEVKGLIGIETYQSILEDAMKSKNYNFASSLYGYFLEKEEYDTLHKYFELGIGYSHNLTSTIFDPFAGEGVWLEMFKQSLKRDEVNSNNLYLIANELEQKRYNAILGKGVVDEVYNSAYEDLKGIPKGSISLLLYNPPYGDTNGKRNVTHYLEMILKNEVMHKSSEYKNGGKIILVIRKDDLIESLPLLVQYFDIERDLIYKTNKKEYKKYKQFVIYATIKNTALDTNNINDSLKLQKEHAELLKVIKANPEFSLSVYNQKLTPPSVPYERLKESHKVVEGNDFEFSVTNGDGWNWFKDLTRIREIENEVIDKPTPIKTGEMSNLIASGMINGVMQMNDETGYHIVAGGMKEKIQQEITQEENRSGELINKTKTILYSQPYLNVLIEENGMVKIKELEGESEVQ